MNAISKPTDLTKSPYERNHETYSGLGYSTIPIGHATKKPMAVERGGWTNLPGWRRYATTPAPTAQRAKWGTMRDADGRGPGIGLVLGTSAGKAPDGQECVTVALDFDPSGTCMNEKAVLDALIKLLPDAAGKKGRRGETLFCRIRTSELIAGCDYAALDGSKVQLLLNGQTVLPPSVHPETQAPYDWTTEHSIQPANELPLLDLAALDAALASVSYSRGTAQHAGLGDADMATARADIANGAVRPNLIAKLKAAGDRLGDLWQNGAMAAYLQSPKSGGGQRDTSGSALRLELARYMRRAAYNGAEFADAIDQWDHAVGKHRVTERDVLRAWAASADKPPNGAALAVPVCDADEPTAAPARTVETRLADYATRYPKVKVAGEIRLAVKQVLTDGSTQTDLVTPQRFPDFAPSDWVEVTDGNRVRSVHLVSLYRKQATPVLAGLRFLPGLPQTESGDWWNTWTGWGVAPAPAGTCELFNHHLRERVCGGSAEAFSYLWRWAAHIVQHPRQKPGVAVILQGAKGCGKSVVGDVLGRLVGARHRAVLKEREHLLGRFNGHLADALLIQVEEAFWARDPKGEGTLKSLITEGQMLVERKGIDAVTAQSFCRVLVTSNESFVVPATVGERRFLVLRMTNPNIAGPIVQAMMAELQVGGYARLMHELLETDLAGFDPTRCPATAALAEQIAQNLPPVEEWFGAETDAGELWQGYATGDEGAEWVKVPAQQLRERFDRWNAKQRAGRVSDAAWSRELKRLGFHKIRTKTCNLWALPPRAESDGAD